MNDIQRDSLRALCERFNAPFDEDDFKPTFDLPSDWVAGWAGPIYVGCDPRGSISS